MKKSIKNLFLILIFFIGSTFSLHSTDNASYKIISYKELDDIVKQSGFTEKKITFIETSAMKSGGFAAASEIVLFSENPETIISLVPEIIPNVILIDPAYATPEQITCHASIILHEIGHIARGHLDRQQPMRLNIFMIALVSTIALARKTLTRTQEREADQFMLEKSTKEQLENVLQFFVDVQKSEQKFKKPFSIPWDLSIYTVINSRLSTHPSTKSRIKKIKRRIKELQA
jgi:hypothetical protein